MEQAGLRSLKDFLLQYNKISETCFLHCVDHLSDRDLSQDECKCVDMCTRKHVSVNHKVMQIYLEVQPQIVNRRIEEMNKQQAALEKNQKDELGSGEKNQIPTSEKPQLDSVPKSKEITKPGEKLAVLTESDKEIVRTNHVQ